MTRSSEKAFPVAFRDRWEHPSLPPLLFLLALLLLSQTFTACVSKREECARAVREYNGGDKDKALQLLERLVKKYPDDDTLRMYLALACRDTGRLDRAAAELEECVRRKPSNGKALALLGEVLRKKGDIERAVERNKQAVRLLVNDSAAWNNLGLCLACAGRYREAIEAYDKALAINPGDPVPLYNQGEIYRRLHQLPRAEQAFEHALSAAPGNPAVLSALAETEFEQGKTAEARRHYNTIVLLNPADFEQRMGRVFYQLARIYLEGRDYQSALRNLELARGKGYDPARLALLEGRILYEKGEYRRAAAVFEKIPGDKWPAMPEISYYLGLCLYETGSYDKALQAFQQALSTDLPKAPVYTGMGLAYLKLFARFDQVRRPAASRPLLDKAVELFNAALSEDPSHVPALMGKARALFKSGKAEAALRIARKVVLLKPRHAPAHLLLGLCSYELGDKEAAVRSTERFVEMEPGSARVLFFLGQLYLETGRAERAEKCFVRGLDKRPDDWDAKIMLSTAYSTRGRYIAAADVLLDVLKRADDPKVLAEARRMYELITRPFRALLFPTADSDEKAPTVPGSLEYIEGKLERARLLRQGMIDGKRSPGALKRLQSEIRRLIVDYNELKRKRLFLDDGDRLYYKNEIRKLIDFFKQSKAAGLRDGRSGSNGVDGGGTNGRRQ